MSWKSVKPMANDPVEAGYYPLALESYEIKTTKPESGSKLMYAVRFRIEESDVPEISKSMGRTLMDWFVIGTDDDPGAEDEATINDEENKGIRKLKRLSEAAEVEPTDPEGNVTTDMLLEILDGCIGKQVTAFVNKKGENNNINSYFKTGERPIGLDSGKKMVSGGAKPNTSKFAPKPNIFQATAAAKAAKAAMTAKPPKNVVVAEVVEEEIEEAPAPKKAVKGGKAPASIICPMGCGEKIEYKMLAAHAETCTGESGTTEEEDE